VFRQIRMNRWRADVPAQDVRAAVAALATMLDQIPDVRAWHQAESVSADDDFDYVVIVDFDDEQAHQRYMQHPEHVRVVTNLVRPLLASTVRIRFTLDPETSA
jgi:heme-degrading monooxygenase HmoA